MDRAATLGDYYLLSAGSVELCLSECPSGKIFSQAAISLVLGFLMSIIITSS
jgi:hypothetical protein